MKSKKLTAFILAGMLLGILAGYFFRQYAGNDAAAIKSFADGMSILTDIFLRLIKMIIAPLVISTLVVGIAKMGDAKSVGRIGGKTMAWFISASLVSLTLGLIMVNILKPGVALNLPLPDLHADSGIKAGAISLKDFVTHAIPKSVFEAMANNEILQIVIFSVFFGSAMAALGERSKALIDVIDVIAHVMLKVTSYVMNFAPLAVFGAIAATVAKEGLSILGTYGKFMAQFYLSIGILWALLIAVGVLIVGPRLLHLMGMIKEPLLLSFTTASSEAAYPKTLEQLERFGVSNKIASFVLPMGYSFNLDGSMMYCTFAVIFIAQAYGIDLTLAQEISMLLILMLTSKGMAGVPRASLVVIAATLAQFNIPEAGLLLLLGIDHFLDMGRSATNVVGNSIATAVVAKWEGELKRH
ncbi:dicarboxylate/amino acid:cation symporter [Chromobacterium alticapitis]|uniref:Dicarboxylate/amino acid:cation symporter n=1 Tax=Chromobacterium alticapitis TaxID=2073169 RepID=A0A2S5DF85_9NEIS|nr:cation:dicarboxylase symporter family transporter [Chromobacterium alticapitis]POZ61770.1 dicarboxylate/amino acid:cation symporter [Chromobacterium alticapitis]